MNKPEDYRSRAAECRALARAAASADIRTQFLSMAERWERLATERERIVAGPTNRQTETDGSEPS